VPLFSLVSGWKSEDKASPSTGGLSHPQAPTRLIVLLLAGRASLWFASGQTVTTLAGKLSLQWASTTTDSLTAKARLQSFNWPYDVSVDTAGTFAITTDTHNCRLRRLNLTSGLVSSIAGNLSCGHADGVGNAALFNFSLWCLHGRCGDLRYHRKCGYGECGADGSLRSLAFVPRIFPQGDQNNHLLRRVNLTSGQVTTVAGNLVGIGNNNYGYADRSGS